MTDLHETASPSAASSPTDVEFISVPEWCRRMGCSLDSGYRAVRRDQVPGLFRIGRLIRINWPAFVEATAVEPADKALDHEPRRGDS
jgi:predicted DNA-binding transcriptional regulator AlpA